MKLFGFEVSGPSSLSVICPKCGNPNANITFIPSKENTEIPFPEDMREVIREAGLSDYLSIPKHDDLHFFCMKCLAVLRSCEWIVFNKDQTKCLLGKRT